MNPFPEYDQPSTYRTNLVHVQIKMTVRSLKLLGHPHALQCWIYCVGHDGFDGLLMLLWLVTQYFYFYQMNPFPHK